MRGVHHLGQAEIENLRLPARGDEDIRRLDVAVDDPLRVGRIQAICNLNRQVQQLIRLKRLAFDAVFKGLSFQQLHGDEGPAFEFVDVMNGADVGMIQCAGGARLTLEAFQSLSIRGKALGQKFEGNEAAELGIFGLVNYAHPAATQLFEDTVVRNYCPNHDLGEPSLPPYCTTAGGANAKKSGALDSRLWTAGGASRERIAGHSKAGQR